MATPGWLPQGSGPAAWGRRSRQNQPRHTALQILQKSPSVIRLLYLLNGVSNNRLSEPDRALESLEMGLDFIIDDTEMEIDYYKELSLAYKLKNNIKKSEAFAKKASALKQ